MNFWRSIGFHTVSAVDNILDKEHFTLEELLDEEDLLQECKSQNKKLLDYLVEPTTLAKLFEYISKEPPADADPKRKFKFPFVASEVLSSDVWSIIEAIYSDEALICQPYSFLDAESPSPLIVSALTKVAAVLFARKIPETMKVLRKKEDALAKFVKHIGATSAMELLMRIITTADNTDGAQIFQWLVEGNLVDKLVAQFDPKNLPDVHENAGMILTEIISMPSSTANAAFQYPHNPLMQQLADEKTIAALLDHILAPGAKSALLHGLTVVIELLRRCVASPADTNQSAESLPTIVKLCVTNLPKFHTMLKNNPGEQMHMTFGTLAPPLGFHRLKLLEFIGALFKTGYRAVEVAITTENIIPTCLDLFFGFPWNNFLHLAVEQVILHILESQNQDLKLYLLRDCQLLTRIVDAANANQQLANGDRGYRLGHMGFVTNISMALQQAAQADQQLTALLDDQAWKGYVSGPLVEIRAHESTPLGGHRPLSFGPDSDDDSDDGEYDDQGHDLNYNGGDMGEDFQEDPDYADSSDVVFQTEVDARDSFPDDEHGDEGHHEEGQVWAQWELKDASADANHHGGEDSDDENGEADVGEDYHHSGDENSAHTDENHANQHDTTETHQKAVPESHTKPTTEAQAV